MKYLLRFNALMLIFILVGTVSYASYSEDVRLIINGKHMEFDPAPIIVNNRTMLPIRFVSESLGFDVGWNGKTREVILNKENKKIILKIGSNKAKVNGINNNVTLDTAPFIKKDRTFVPLRFISETFGESVDWDGKNRVVIIGNGINKAQIKKEIRKINDKLVAKKLEEIISLPIKSIKPYNYINAHKDAYKKIVEMGDVSFDYMMREFKNGRGTGMRANIMAFACRDILGTNEEIYDGNDWYINYRKKGEIKLADFKYKGDDENLKLVYDAYVKPNYFEKGGFMVLAPSIVKVVKEDDMTKIFTRIRDDRYKLYGDLLVNTGGEISSVAFTFKDNKIVKVEEDDPKKIMEIDGRICVTTEEFLKTPVSRKIIKGLEEEMRNPLYHDYMEKKAYANLAAHLKENGIEKATLYMSSGEIEFKMGE